jgi:hypothetical protein
MDFRPVTNIEEDEKYSEKKDQKSNEGNKEKGRERERERKERKEREEIKNEALLIVIRGKEIGFAATRRCAVH